MRPRGSQASQLLGGEQCPTRLFARDQLGHSQRFLHTRASQQPGGSRGTVASGTLVFQQESLKLTTTSRGYRGCLLADSECPERRHQLRLKELGSPSPDLEGGGVGKPPQAGPLLG